METPTPEQWVKWQAHKSNKDLVIEQEEKLEGLSEDEAMERQHDNEVEQMQDAVEKDLEKMEQDFGNAGNY